LGLKAFNGRGDNLAGESLRGHVIGNVYGNSFPRQEASDPPLNPQRLNPRQAYSRVSTIPRIFLLTSNCRLQYYNY
jgi:hypothetical protein